MSRPPTFRALFDLSPDELVIDFFAGGGGTSAGIDEALEEMGRHVDIAINHDPEAIAMHKANHPRTHHVCGDMRDAKPRLVCDGRPVGVAWFSPDCTYHSKARGGKPFRDRNEARGKRGLAWEVVRWAVEVRPRMIFVENVEEFADWGPLLPDGTPDPERKGLSFRIWLGRLRGLGYQVEMRELRACDYGAPTIRKRLFLIARCDGKPIVWPQPTHGKGLEPYRTAAECIDWTLPCPSIFGRKKPLAEKTLRRIARGVMRYVVEAADPFIVPVNHGGDERVHSIREPLRTVTGAHRGEHAVVGPVLVRTDMHKSNAGCAYPPGDPLRTVTSGGAHAVVAAALTKYHGGESFARVPPLDEPMRTLDTANRFGLVAASLTKFQQNSDGQRVDEPLHTAMAGATRFGLVGATLIQTGYGERPGQAPRVPGLEKPLGTVVGDQKHALVTAFLAKHNGGHEATGSAMADPMSTVTTRDNKALAAVHMLKLHGSCADGQPIDQPAPTVRAKGTHLAEVRTFLLKYYGAEGRDQQQSLFEPLHTITTKPRFGLVTIRGEQYAIADIGMRMLEPRELYRAQSFRDGYRIDIEVLDKRGRMRPLTKEAQVRMCGNSVPPKMAWALVGANVRPLVEARAS